MKDLVLSSGTGRNPGWSKLRIADFSKGQ